MSIDVHWETLTSGPDGKRYAEHVRSFVHSRFQSIAFPKFIKSVTVHSFSFGSVPPEIEIKGLCDPYAEFYEEDDEYGSDEASGDGEEDARGDYYPLKLERERRRRERREDQSTGGTAQGGSGGGMPQPPPYSLDGSRSTGSTGGSPFRSPFIPEAFPGRVGVAAGVTTPLFNRAGSSSNLHYFHSALSPGFAGGANSPSLPAFQSPVAKSNPPNNNHNPARSTTSTGSSVPSRPSTADSVARMASLNLANNDDDEGVAPALISRSPPSEGESQSRPRRASSSAIPRLTEPRDEDTQILARVRYAGDLRLELTAELLLEYPITNFVALPVRLVVTGCKFDGLACVAYIRRRAHFCFIDEEQAGEGGGDNGRANSVLKEIKVESEIGEKGKGKQVLKNVGKVERFVLEHVRRIFEEEFMFPSSWTFLV